PEERQAFQGLQPPRKTLLSFLNHGPTGAAGFSGTTTTEENPTRDYGTKGNNPFRENNHAGMRKHGIYNYVGILSPELVTCDLSEVHRKAVDSSLSNASNYSLRRSINNNRRQRRTSGMRRRVRRPSEYNKTT
ncbi:MAG: hypothetical protein AAFO91_18155, partial [Bacteroidota bacterium]